MKITVQGTQQKHINELEKENEMLYARNRKLSKQIKELRSKLNK